MTYKDFISEWKNEEDFIIANTSGSTGTPKEIKLLKLFVRESAIRTIEFFDIQKGQRLHSCISPDFIGGKMMAVRAVISDSLLTYENPSNQPLKNLNHKETIDLLAVVPSQMIYIIENLENLPKLKNIIIGGSAIHPELRNKIIFSGLNAYETYGMTETASHIALRKITNENAPFKLLSGITISLDERNCLKISFRNEQEIQTNDIADIISENEFFIKGRYDEIIISGGKKINPFEIESRISNIIPLPFFITGIPDEKWGEKIVLIIEGSEKLIPENKLKTLLKQKLENWEIPKKIIYLNKLPRTTNGKIIRIKNLSTLLSFADDKNHVSGGQNMLK